MENVSNLEFCKKQIRILKNKLSKMNQKNLALKAKTLNWDLKKSQEQKEALNMKQDLLAYKYRCEVAEERLNQLSDMDDLLDQKFELMKQLDSANGTVNGLKKLNESLSDKILQLEKETYQRCQEVLKAHSLKQLDAPDLNFKKLFDTLFHRIESLLE